MKERFSLVIPLLAGAIVVALLIWQLPRGWWDAWRFGRRASAASAPTEPPKPKQQPVSDPEDAGTGSAGDDEAFELLLERLRQRLESPDARPNEALLAFSSEEAYRRFLARAESAGLAVLGQLDGLRIARVGYDSLEALQRDMLANAGDYEDVGANYYVHIPGQPLPEDRVARPEQPFGDYLLPFLGVADNSTWGKGIRIAILDSGVVPDPTFGQGRVQYIDVGQGLFNAQDGDGHGTAVAALAAGASPDARGLAPAADILSIRVTDNTGVSDIFTLSSALMTAVDSGADVVNISLGAYYGSRALSEAIAYAVEHGVAVVAAAGNDQANQLTWPAADPRVISVGAVDALEQQVMFSNSGEELKMSAPGYGLPTAWLDGQRIIFDGTSGSSPIVAGSIAAVMSQTPGINALEAWEILRAYSNDAGPQGRDEDYGYGIVNPGWAMNRDDPDRFDTAVASHYYNPETGRMEVVVQNRSGRSVNGMELSVSAGTRSAAFDVPSLAPGTTWAVAIPIEDSMLDANGSVAVRSSLSNPDGSIDVIPSNNRKASRVYRVQ